MCDRRNWGIWWFFLLPICPWLYFQLFFIFSICQGLKKTVKNKKYILEPRLDKEATTCSRRRILCTQVWTRRGSKIFLFISQNTFLGRIGSIWEMGGCSARQNKVHIDTRLFGFKKKLGFWSTEALGLLTFCFFGFWNIRSIFDIFLDIF